MLRSLTAAVLALRQLTTCEDDLCNGRDVASVDAWADTTASPAQTATLEQAYRQRYVETPRQGIRLGHHYVPPRTPLRFARVGSIALS